VLTRRKTYLRAAASFFYFLFFIFFLSAHELSSRANGNILLFAEGLAGGVELIRAAGTRGLRGIRGGGEWRSGERGGVEKTGFSEP
jgi:hypothetical protein